MGIGIAQILTCDINKDIGETYKIEFNDNIINPENVLFNGEPVKIIKHIKEATDYGIDQKLKVAFPNGIEKIIDINDLDFKYHLIP